jgi:ATP-dependent DNA helicase DinG
MAGGGSGYDDRVVRARLAQAFGRLIRRQSDCGMFVIMSAAMPSRLLRAFPPGVPVSRVPLDEAIVRVRQRLVASAQHEAELTSGVIREVILPRELDG